MSGAVLRVRLAALAFVAMVLALAVNGALLPGSALVVLAALNLAWCALIWPWAPLSMRIMLGVAAALALMGATA